MLPFGFEPTEELPKGYCSRVYATERLVLKVPFQGEELTSGFRAAHLLAQAGLGPRIFDSDPETGAILMERILPGTKLNHSLLSESERIVIFADFVAVMQGLPFEGCLDLSAYTKTPEGLSECSSGVFLHGDLHHENILLGPDGRWIVIDPKGLVGDPCFAASAWLRNPLGQLGDAGSFKRLLSSRLKYLEKRFGWDPERMMKWTLADLGPDPEEPEWAMVSRVLGDVLSR